MIKHLKVFTIITLFLAVSSTTGASSSIFLEGDPLPRTSSLQWLHNNFLKAQRIRIDTLTRNTFGKQISGNKDDIPVLQRLITNNVIDPKEKETLQALGVVLGDIYVKEHPSLEWQIYEDDLGKSHAVCVTKTKHCIFVITMLSRRIEAGATPNVQTVYNKGYDALKPFMPKRPFSR